jgi:membrane protein
MLVPMRRVPVRHALVGGITAALLFELAKRGFGTYLTYFPTYQAIYGALATFPIFLVWVFLSWLVTLFGAELTYCLGIRHYSRGRGYPAGAGLGDAVAFLEALWRAQLDGRGLSVDELAGAGAIPAATAEELAENFSAARWIAAGEDGAWLLSRDLHMLTLTDLYNLGGFAMPDTGQLADLSRDGRINLAEVLVRGRDELTGTLDVPLTSVFREASTGHSRRDDGAAGNVEEDA